MSVVKIISGAQTGADQAALRAAVDLGLQVGGWIPQGRRTDAGRLSDELFAQWHLTEHPSPAYPPRTEQNVRDSDGTAIFGNPYSPGCVLTTKLARRHHKPIIIMEVNGYDAETLIRWLLNNHIRTLNVAGNRERINPGIGQLTYDTLIKALGSTK